MDGPPILASGCGNGSFAIWDLSKGRIAHVQRGAHEKSIAGLEWVQGQPLLMTSSEDNSIKVSYITHEFKEKRDRERES